jgi:hypothetical protein
VLLFIVESGFFMLGVDRLGGGCYVVCGRVVFKCVLFFFFL